jgi:hypothetical protein
MSDCLCGICGCNRSEVQQEILYIGRFKCGAGRRASRHKWAHYLGLYHGSSSAHENELMNRPYRWSRSVMVGAEAVGVQEYDSGHTSALSWFNTDIAGICTVKSTGTCGGLDTRFSITSYLYVNSEKI